MLSTIAEDSNEILIDEVIFAVKSNEANGNNLTYHNGICSIFSSQSPVFNKLIKKHKKQNKNGQHKGKRIYLKYMTLQSFCFIRNTFYDLNPPLTYNTVVDILYSSIKYELSSVIEQCSAFFMDIDDIDDYFVVIKSFSFYPKALFESFFLNNYTSKSQFIDNNIEEIISDQRLINESSLFQIQIFCSYVLSKNLINNKQCYVLLTKWCRDQFNNKFKSLLCIKYNEHIECIKSGEISTNNEQLHSDTLSTSNASNISLMSFDHNNDYMITKWQDLFEDFISLIDFRQIDIEYLLMDVRNDGIMPEQDLLSILLKKYEYDKHHQATAMKNDQRKTNICQKSTCQINNNNNNKTNTMRRVSTVSTSSSLSNWSVSSYSSHMITNNDTFKSENMFLKGEELKAFGVGSKMDLRDNFGRYLKAEIIESKENESDKFKIHFIGWNSMWDKWIDIEEDYYLITSLGNITDRGIHKVQIQDLEIGDKVIVKLPNYHKHNRFGWMHAEIINMDGGQLNVQYKLNDEGHLQNHMHEFWVHADNIDECR